MKFSIIIAASAAALMVAGTAGTASATTYRPANPTDAGDRMAAPPWWYPTWGTWVGGPNIKICKDLTETSTTPSENGPIIHVNNIDGTDLEFKLDLKSSGSVAVWQSLIAACDHSDDHSDENWKHRWYKIDLRVGGPGVHITELSGAGSQHLDTILSVTVPTGHSVPSH